MIRVFNIVLVGITAFLVVQLIQKRSLLTASKKELADLEVEVGSFEFADPRTIYVKLLDEKPGFYRWRIEIPETTTIRCYQGYGEQNTRIETRKAPGSYFDQSYYLLLAIDLNSAWNSESEREYKGYVCSSNSSSRTFTLKYHEAFLFENLDLCQIHLAGKVEGDTFASSSVVTLLKITPSEELLQIAHEEFRGFQVDELAKSYFLQIELPLVSTSKQP